MATVAVYNMQGAEVGKMDLNDAIFGVEVNEHLVKIRRRKKTMEAEGNRSRKTGFNKSSAVDRRWCCIRSSTERLHH